MALALGCSAGTRSTPAASPAASSASASASSAPAVSSIPVHGSEPAWSPAGESAEPAKPKIDGNDQDFFAAPALARLEPAEREQWQRYLAASKQLRVVDRESLEAELRRMGKRELERAAYGKGFRLEPFMTRNWFRSEEGERLADALLSFQTPSGGWSKRVDYRAGPRRVAQSYYSETSEHDYIATIDNDSTTSQLVFLSRAHAATSDARYVRAFQRGVDYLLAAQQPSGCFPQVYPLQGGYHDAATFNDNATVNALELLGLAAHGDHGLLTPERRERAARAILLGVSCIVRSQVVVRGQRTAWGQQHDPLSLLPVPARSYELVGLSGRESAGITQYLMSLPKLDAAGVEAVHAAVDWFRAHAIHGFSYDEQVLKKADDAEPLWARLYELGTNRPIFSNRDGVKRYDWNELTDRRQGYAWYSQEPAAVLAQYSSWSAAHPRSKKPASSTP